MNVFRLRPYFRSANNERYISVNTVVTLSPFLVEALVNVEKVDSTPRLISQCSLKRQTDFSTFWSKFVGAATLKRRELNEKYTSNKFFGTFCTLCNIRRTQCSPFVIRVANLGIFDRGTEFYRGEGYRHVAVKRSFT